MLDVRPALRREPAIDVARTPRDGFCTREEELAAGVLEDARAHRALLGAEAGGVEPLHVGESEDVDVERAPRVHGADREGRVQVIDLEQLRPRQEGRRFGGRPFAVARRVGAGIARAVDERVQDVVTEPRDGRVPDDPERVLLVPRRDHALRSERHGCVVCSLHVVDAERDVTNAFAVLCHVLVDW